MDRSARPDDGSPARLIAIMVGIVGILLLGSLAWSAVGALFSAFGEATSSFSTNRSTPTRLTALVGTPTIVGTPTVLAAGSSTVPAAASGATPALSSRSATPAATTGRGVTPAATAAAFAATSSGSATPSANITPEPSDALTPAATSSLEPTPTPVANPRAPWILLPQPAPDSHVTSGPLVIEARGRGDTPIAAIRLDLDGVPLAVSLEQRSESTWRGFANTKITSGHHAVRAIVVDQDGKTGSYRWTFDAGP